MNEYFIGTVIKQVAEGIIFECNAVGYHLKGVDLNQIALGEQIRLYIYYYQKPPISEYFAFLTSEIKQYFCELISISQIGPKTALRILNSIKIEQLKLAISLENFATLQTCRGITKRLAQAIITHFHQKQLIYQVDPVYHQKWATVFAALSKLGFGKDAINSCLLKVNWALSIETLIKNSMLVLQNDYY